VSIGIVPGNPEYRTPAEILRDADTAMYKAKSWPIALRSLRREMRAEAVARLELESDLRRAVDNQEFVLYYQPKVSLKPTRLSA
jgi:predicted signal transduction protein with EAL and GGDEF domain